MITEKQVIFEMLSNADKNSVSLAYSFRNSNGETVYAIFMDYKDDTMADNTEEKDIVCLMASGMLTIAGEIFLLEQKESDGFGSKKIL